MKLMRRARGGLAMKYKIEFSCCEFKKTGKNLFSMIDVDQKVSIFVKIYKIYYIYEI